MRSNKRDRQAIREYFELQSDGDPVLHVEKAASERVGSMAHDVWDVIAESGRWWVVTNPTNFYRQEDFKSRDVVLTFHVGLMARVASQRTVPITDDAADFFPGVWRRWEQAVEALGPAREAEDFQAVGMRLRECLVSMADEFAADHLVEGKDRPKDGDVKAWVELLANHIAGGHSSEKLRSYLKKTSTETWAYVNWLTHAKNAGHWDAEIGVAITSHLIEMITASTMRWARGGRPVRCGDCESYEVVGGECRNCGWLDPDYEAPELAALSEEKLAKRLAEPCVLTSDISTIITPDDCR